jgi:transposase, IS30 family
MEAYHRLTLDDRYQIQAEKNSGLGIREIAMRIGRSPSTVSRELKRNSRKYSPQYAHKCAAKRRAGVGPPQRMGALKDQIEYLLRLQWSPEQISGRLLNSGVRISHETIYRHIFKDFQNGGDLYFNLRRKRRYRRPRKITKTLKRNGFRTNQTWIDDRPRIVEKRKRIGDFERDTVLGKNGRLLTIVDRKSRLTKIGKIEKHNAYYTHLETLKLLKGHVVHTITNDNGPEFAFHNETAKDLKTKVYFSRPYSSWQRGTNENTNGLIRQYYPKGTDFSKVSNEQIAKIEQRLNERPRKCLGFRTPSEVHQV